MTLIDEATLEAVNAGAKLLHIHRFGENESSHVKRLLEWADFPHEAIIYDMGSGLGELTRLMSHQRPDITFNLVNISDEQIRLTDMPVLKRDFTDTGLPESSIDAAMYVFSIGHANHSTSMKEAARIIRPGGILFIYDMLGDDTAMREYADYSLLPESEMEQLAIDNGFKLTFSLSPEDYDMTEARSIIGETDFLKLFGKTKPMIWRFVRA